MVRRLLFGVLSTFTSAQIDGSYDVSFTTGLNNTSYTLDLPLLSPITKTFYSYSFCHSVTTKMHTVNIMWLVLFTTSIVGLATWAALASVTYNWASEHSGVKRHVIFPLDLVQPPSAITAAATRSQYPGHDLPAIRMSLGHEVSVHEDCRITLEYGTHG